MSGGAVTPEKVRTAMAQADGNKVAAARLLGVSTNTLYKYLERMGLHTRTTEPREMEAGVEAVRVEVGLSGLVDARVVFDDGWAP